jgi:hypothetical protein
MLRGGCAGDDDVCAWQEDVRRTKICGWGAEEQDTRSRTMCGAGARRRNKGWEEEHQSEWPSGCAQEWKWEQTAGAHGGGVVFDRCKMRAFSSCDISCMRTLRVCKTRVGHDEGA